MEKLTRLIDAPGTKHLTDFIQEIIKNYSTSHIGMSSTVNIPLLQRPLSVCGCYIEGGVQFTTKEAIGVLGLNLALWPTVTSNSQCSSLYLATASLTEVYHQTCFKIKQLSTEGIQKKRKASVVETCLLCLRNGNGGWKDTTVVN